MLGRKYLPRICQFLKHASLFVFFDNERTPTVCKTNILNVEPVSIKYGKYV